MKKVLSAVLAALMAMTLFVGCSNKPGSQTADGKTKFTLGLPGGSGGTAWKIVENFETANADKYEIVKDESAWSDFNKKLQLQMASKQEVTTVYFTDSMKVMTFGANGQALDLKGWVDSELDASLYNDALFSMTDSEGHLWGVPHAMNSIAVVYNKDIFDKQGVAYPTEDWTWQDMLDMAAELTHVREDGTKVYGIHYLSNITQGWWPFMSAVGVNPYKDNFQYSNLDDPKIIEAMEKYQQPITDGYVMAEAEIAAIGGADQAFAQGLIGMMIMQASSLTKVNTWAPDLNYDAMIMPIGWNGERTCIYVPNCWQVYSGADEAQQAASLDWLKYYLSEESQMLVATEGPSGFPIMKSALETVANAGKKPENIEAFYEGIDEYGETILESPASAVSNSVINEMVAGIRSGDDVEARVAEAHAALQTTLNDFYER